MRPNRVNSGQRERPGCDRISIILHGKPYLSLSRTALRRDEFEKKGLSDNTTVCMMASVGKDNGSNKVAGSSQSRGGR